MDEKHVDESWISALQRGDSAAAQKLWQAYYQDLVRYAQKRLPSGSRRVADEEDVALSAIHSFCRAAADGRFPQLEDHGDLWRILVTITARKAIRQAQRERRRKRGGGRVRGESVFLHAERSESPRAVEQVVGSEPTPGFAAEMAEQLATLLDRLDNDTLQQIVVLKMQGCTNQEIAEKIGCAVRSVERKLQGIRTIWSTEHSRQ